MLVVCVLFCGLFGLVVATGPMVGPLDYVAEIEKLKTQFMNAKDTQDAEIKILKLQVQSQQSMSEELNHLLGEANKKIGDLSTLVDTLQSDQRSLKYQCQNGLREQNTRLSKLAQMRRNVKEFTWRSLHDYTDKGLIKSVTFTKTNASSALKLTWNGDLRSLPQRGGIKTCNRWFFVINGKECSNPAPIDGLIEMSNVVNIHRPSSIEGLCFDIAAGNVKIDFYVGNCPAGLLLGDAHTCFGTTCRILVEELNV